MENLVQGYIHIGDNLEVLQQLPDGFANLIYIDPPFNTGKIQARTQIQVERDEQGDRVGFQGNRYSSTVLGTKAYTDQFDDYLAFLMPRLEEAYRVLTDDGTLYFHIDYREVHYCKLLLDQIFGRENFINEIIWAYDYGGRPKNRWPAKHDNILMYVKDRGAYTFNTNDIDRIPYMAPGLVGKEKAKKGKLPTDTWWHTIVSPTGKEKTGYPTQKPLGVLKRIVAASSHPGDMVLDFFAGSGTTGEAALELGRRFFLVDDNPEACEVMKTRFAGKPVEFIEVEEQEHGEKLMTNNSKKTYDLGQSIWYDNIERRLLENGEMEGMIKRGEIYGVTSNPSIFNKAIGETRDYDSALIPLAREGKSAEEIFEALAVADIQRTADLFSELYQTTEGGDGYVSLEVNPDLANMTDETLAEVKRLWKLVDRPNLMVKIPATKEGLPAIAESIAEGINVNVTLIFSQERYEEVMDAYIAGLKKRVKAGKPVDRIASVASFFVSRQDTNVDQKLADKVEAGELDKETAESLFGKAAIANTKLAYQRFRKVFEGQRFLDLKSKGARLQRPLWASTSTKNPAYSDVLYVENLIGPHTVNTIPPSTLAAFNDHGRVALTLEDGVHEAEQVFIELEAAGISIEQVTYELEVAGVKAFSDAFHALLGTVESRRQAEI